MCRQKVVEHRPREGRVVVINVASRQRRRRPMLVKDVDAANQSAVRLSWRHDGRHNDIQHNDTGYLMLWRWVMFMLSTIRFECRYAECLYAECLYAECLNGKRRLYWVSLCWVSLLLSVVYTESRISVMLSVTMLSVGMPRVVMLSVVVPLHSLGKTGNPYWRMKDQYNWSPCTS